MEATFSMVKMNPATDEPTYDNFHVTSVKKLYTRGELNNFIDDCMQTANERLENTERQLSGSGWYC